MFTMSESVPIIDITRLESPRTLETLHRACRDWGFFQVENHGIDAYLTRGLRQAMRDFFSQSAEQKQQLGRTRDNPWGYYDRELTKNVRDWKEVYDYGPSDGKRIVAQWPDGLSGFRPAVEAYSTACEDLSFRLLAGLSTNLGLPPDHLAQWFRSSHTSFLRLNHYPPCPAPAAATERELAASGHLGVNYHTDAGALTLLLQDEQPGLEVFREGRWHLVEPRRDALVINIGDIVQVWSNDLYEAALHRVVLSSEKARMSAPFFFNPCYSACYAPLPTMIDEHNPARYRPINWGEFRSRRADGDYADYGAEIQITDYRIHSPEA
jgi:isopenicillin N synthase-like dioxygenase